MRYNKVKLYKLFFFIFLFGVSIGNVILQFASIVFLGLIGLFFIKSNKIFFPIKDVFYVLMILISFIQILFFFNEDYSLNYVINSLITTFLWALMLMCSIVIVRLISTMSMSDIDEILIIFFKINVLFIIIQYIGLSIKHVSLIPFLSSMGAGDFIKGVFTNSSVNMIILSFFSVYFFYTKKMRLAIVALLCISFTTYMSGIVLYIGTVLLFAFFYLPIKFKTRIALGTIVGFLVFSIISPKNIEYVKSNLTKKLFAKRDQARKIVSFEQTIDYSLVDASNFIFGAGAGKFSSRTAFMTAGEYVSWYPESLIYASEEFNNNHFELWNEKILSRPYKDGTANQPFSFYNKMIGEYGLIGFIIFILFYLFYPLRGYKKLTYGRLLLFLLLAYFILDYWFEYFTVIVFFEIFMYMDILRYKNEEV
ncbi:hypothetical protein FBALC1_00295 [Flavobacteriales bacterium ALC-1]|nr:hypothetical protein FBALC1_00295 [Flavobacteriales bacterium ALC-1]